MSIPDRLGDFRIVEEIGRGGFGVVYRAEQNGLGREVAVKLDAVQVRGAPREGFRDGAVAGADFDDRVPRPHLLGHEAVRLFRQPRVQPDRLHHFRRALNILPKVEPLFNRSALLEMCRELLRETAPDAL